MLDRHRTSGWFFEIYFKCLYFYRVLNRKLLYKINVEVLIYSIGRILFSVLFNFTLLWNVAYNDFFVWSNNCFVKKGNKIMLRKVAQSRKSHTFIPINHFYLEKVSIWGSRHLNSTNTFIIEKFPLLFFMKKICLYYMYINKKDTDIINHPDPKQSSLQSGKKRKH